MVWVPLRQWNTFSRSKIPTALPSPAKSPVLLDFSQSNDSRAIEVHSWGLANRATRISVAYSSNVLITSLDVGGLSATCDAGVLRSPREAALMARSELLSQCPEG